jgi:circadian clock protein KaiB
MKADKPPKPLQGNKMELQLYISGMSPKSMEAVENIKRLCDKFLHNNFKLEIIDIYKNPGIAAQEQIIFSPSLIKRLPLPKKILIGNFANVEKVMKGLGITFER